MGHTEAVKDICFSSNGTLYNYQSYTDTCKGKQMTMLGEITNCGNTFRLLTGFKQWVSYRRRIFNSNKISENKDIFYFI